MLCSLVNPKQTIRADEEHVALKHDFLAASIIAPHRARPVVVARVLPCGSCLRLGGVWRRRRAGLFCIGWHSHAKTHAEPLVASRDVVEAARVLCGVVADGRVLVGTLRALEGKPVWTQEVIQVLVTVARWKWRTAVAAVQWKREATESRVPARVCSRGGVGVFDDVELGELSDCWASIVVRVSWVDCAQNNNVKSEILLNQSKCFLTLLQWH